MGPSVQVGVKVAWVLFHCVGQNVGHVSFGHVFLGHVSLVGRKVKRMPLQSRTTHPSHRNQRDPSIRSHTDLLVIHCAATRPEQDIGVAEIRLWHQKRGWRDIGYHYVIRRSGLIENGRPAHHIGAHVRGYNECSLGICLIGGLDSTGQVAADFTPEQWIGLQGLVTQLLQDHLCIRVLGHCDLDSGKACPGFDVANWLTRNHLKTKGNMI